MKPVMRIEIARGDRLYVATMVSLLVAILTLGILKFVF